MGSASSAQPVGIVNHMPSQTDNPPPYQPTPTAWKFKPHNTQSYISINLRKYKKDPVPGELNHHWHAELTVVDVNVAYLMRHGFHWDESHVQEERGFFETGNQLVEPLRRHGWFAIRYYYLASAPGTCADGQWTAQLRVLSDEVKNVSDFRISHLSIPQITRCSAYVSGRRVYYFGDTEPENSINVFYDDMPLKGWWPWPRTRKDKDLIDDL